MKEIDRGSRPATAGEKETLARFPSFGPVALTIFPDPATGQYKSATWRGLGEELKDLLTPEEYESARRSTFNAFYTSPTVIAAIYEALARLGVPDDATVLEPGCGSGRFLSQARRGMRIIAVELDCLSGRIAQLLHPDYDVRIEDFRDTRVPEGSTDAVIGNVPFADIKIEYAGERFSLHDFFLTKSVDTLRPGGVLAAVTTHFTLDKQNASAREYLAAKADFIGAIRLPSDAFKREGTAVVADILFLRKRAVSEPARHAEPDWLIVAPLAVEGTEVTVNGYFLRRPEMVLGTWTRQDTLYGEGYGVKGEGDLAVRLREAVSRLPTFPPFEPAPVRRPPTEVLARPPPQRYITEGSFFVRDDRVICRVVNGQTVPVVRGGRMLRAGCARSGRRLASLIRLRDAARRVLESQNEGWPEERRVEARRDLTWAYELFTSRFGPINRTTLALAPGGRVVRRMPNLAVFRDDPDAMLVMSLEHYNEETGAASKAAIMTQDVVGRTPPITQVRSAAEGLLVSLNERGRVDLPFIAGLYGRTEQEVVAELGSLIYHDPESATWQTADAYLSGNVRAKLAAVLSAGDAYVRNVEALAAVQPEDLLPGDIDANLGAPWIPVEEVQVFAAELFRVEPSSVPVAHLSRDALWSVGADGIVRQSVAATAEYGTPRANGVWLLELALNMKSPAVYDTLRDGDRELRVLNREATLAAREKQRLIKEKLRAWVFADPERAERLVRLYNDLFNNLRPRLFDGGHLDFPGMSRAVELRPHQKDAVWRGVSAGNTLLAHAVGAGKTFVMAATGMKMRQAGLVRKPMYVVPNHLLEQFAREFLQLYPNAKLLVTTKADLARDRRKLLTAKVASGDWDGVLVTHSTFERIGMSRGYRERFLREQIAGYDELLRRHAAEKGTDRNLLKAIEKQKAAREQKLKELLAEHRKDDGLVFDELGVDHLFIDEAHAFKNLETPTKMGRVAGVQTGGSERAFDLLLKARYLYERHAGHGVTFATGTPVSNTMVELYTLQRFLDPEGLKSRGVEHFDAWAAAFGEVVETTEISPDGASLRPRSRFARFTNLTELQQMFCSFADVQTVDMLALPRPALETGKPIVVACPMSPDQRSLQRGLVERYERLRCEHVDPREDNALAITTDGRKLALDARMLSARASDFSGSKLNALADSVAGIWAKSASSRSAQMVFCDLGVHPTAWGFSVYEEVTRKLVSRGIPRQEIAAVSEADTDAAKQALFERVRAGRVRVLLGSTQKMGAGTNVQRRLIALHHLDAPWKPAEVEQREGRILRQGNENKTVAVYRYVTEGSFDAYVWQALETKARFISQVITGQSAARTAEDLGCQELSYAEVKAIASGNPAVLTLAEAEAELARLSVLKKNHADEQYVARKNVRDLPGVIRELSERITALVADRDRMLAGRDEEFTVGERPCSRDETVELLGRRLDSLPEFVRERQRFPLGVYRGLRFGVVLHPESPPEIYLEGVTSRRSMLSREHHGPRAILNAVERLAGGYDAECARLRLDLLIAEARLRDYQARLGNPFPHDFYLRRLTVLRDSLKKALSGVASDPRKAPQHIAAEIADETKAFMAAHSIERSPERVRRRAAHAEEPVTARIRRQTESLLGRNRPLAS